MENIQQTSPQLAGFRDLFRGTLSFYKKNYKEITIVSLLPIFFYVLYYIWFLWLDVNNSTNPTIIVTVSVIVSTLFFVVETLATIALYKRIKSADANEAQLPIMESYRGSMKLFWPFIWVSILVGLVYMGGFILFIIPGMIIGVYTVFYMLSMIIDGERGLNALSYSFYYIQNNFRKILTRLAAFFLTVGLFYLVLILISAGIYMLSGGEFTRAGFIGVNSFLESHPTIGLVTDFVLNLIYWFIVFPISIIYSYLLFKSLKSTKPVPDLSTSFQKSRNWFKGLAIFGLCASVIIFVVVPLMRIK